MFYIIKLSGIQTVRNSNCQELKSLIKTKPSVTNDSPHSIRTPSTAPAHCSVLTALPQRKTQAMSISTYYSKSLTASPSTASKGQGCRVCTPYYRLWFTRIHRSE